LDDRHEYYGTELGRPDRAMRKIFSGLSGGMLGKRDRP
jgi:hypothetical protein